MELYAKGQLSYLILTCMQERDFYGLDIISEISNRSNSRINLKKPSVYSNLTRMEKQGYISSYLQNSDYGPNRKYYSLTEKGRNFYNELKSYFEMNNIDVFKDFTDFEEKSDVQEQKIEQSTDQSDFFDFSSISQAESSTNTNTFVIDSALDIENIDKSAEEVQVEEIKNDAVFLPSENIDEYNKRLYDISKDINKIKRKRSFADDQIAMTATAPLDMSNEKIKTSIQAFKTSILENRDKYQENRTSSFDYFKQKEEVKNSNTISSVLTQKNESKEEKNDAKFITERISINQIERAKKIEPPRLKIVSENTKDLRLPAPNRDKNIDPSHKEILNQLYSKTKDGNSSEVRADAIYDYNDLKDYYKSQGINFNVYEKSMNKTAHNTNKLYLINSLIVFLVCAILSTALFLVFNSIGFVNINTNFLYILLPALWLVDVGYKLYNYKNYSSWIPSQIKPQWQMWLSYFASSVVLIGLNFAFGLAVLPFELFASTLVLPLTTLFIIIPFRYYLKRIILVKFWK